MTTVAPRWAKPSASPRPIPRLAPETSTTWSFTENNRSSIGTDCSSLFAERLVFRVAARLQERHEIQDLVLLERHQHAGRHRRQLRGLPRRDLVLRKHADLVRL